MGLLRTPLATAAAVATMDLYKQEELFERSSELAPYFEEAVHSLKDMPHVIDVRNLGLMCGVELAPVADHPGRRAYQCFLECYDKGVLVRSAGETVALTPPLIANRQHVDQIVGTMGEALMAIA